MSPSHAKVDQILKLRQEGYSPSKIARKLQLTYEEVKDTLESGGQSPASESTLEEYFDEARRRQQFQRDNSLRYRNQVCRKFEDNQPIAITFFSDVHLGSSGVDYDQLQADVATIYNTEGMYVIHNGDEINNFIIGRLQACSRHDVLQPDAQWKFVRLFFQRLAAKTVCAVRGNHTDWTEMLSDVDVRGQICAHLNILDIGHGGRIDLDVAGAEYAIYMRHKYRFESQLNPFNAVVRMFEMISAFDVGVIGHTHVAGISTQCRQERHFVAIRPGSYKVHDAYAEEWGFTGSKCISPTVIFMPGEKRMIHFETVAEAAEYLAFLRQK